MSTVYPLVYENQAILFAVSRYHTRLARMVLAVCGAGLDHIVTDTDVGNDLDWIFPSVINRQANHPGLYIWKGTIRWHAPDNPDDDPYETYEGTVKIACSNDLEYVNFPTQDDWNKNRDYSHLIVCLSTFSDFPGNKNLQIGLVDSIFQFVADRRCGDEEIGIFFPEGTVVPYGLLEGLGPYANSHQIQDRKVFSHMEPPIYSGGVFYPRNYFPADSIPDTKWYHDDDVLHTIKNKWNPGWRPGRFFEKYADLVADLVKAKSKKL